MHDLNTPQRQSKKIIVFYLLKSIKGLLLYFLFAAIGTNSMGKYGWYMTLFIMFLAIMSLITPILKYVYFTFHIENNELIIQKGLLQKERKAIPLERIQSININQNLVQRILGIVSFEVETAGSKAKELEIPGLDKSFASQFKEQLQERKEELVEEEPIDTIEKVPSSAVLEDVEQPIAQTEKVETSRKTKSVEEILILKLGLFDLLKVGITQNHLRSGGLAIALVFGGWFKVKDILEEYFDDWTEQLSWENVISSATLGLVLVAIISFLMISVLISLGMVINKYWDFCMIKKGADLEIKMGLFNKKEIKIPLSKVQILEFHSNPLRKLLGFQTAKIYQAQSTNNLLSNVSVPACKEVHQALLQSYIFKQPVEEKEQELYCNPYSHARLRFYVLSVFFIPLLGAGFYFQQYVGIAFLIVLFILLVAAAFMYGKKSKIMRDDDFVVFQKGWIFPQRVISPIFKTQAVEKWRSIFLKRRGEAHFKLHTAGGTRGLRYLKESELNSLINSVNNDVICSEKRWM